MHFTQAAQRNEANSLRDTGFEPHRGTRGDIEPMPMRGIAVEPQLSLIHI